MRLLAQEVHEGVSPAADLVDLGRDGAQLAFGTHVAEVHRERAQQLFGDEVDRPDVGVQEARHVALEEVGVGDVDAAQAELDVERRGKTFVERGVRLDDVHPAADLGQVERVDHRLPVVRRALDLGVLEAPVQDVLDDPVGGPGVAGLADRHADGLVALEAHEQERVTPVAEEDGEASQDALGIGVPFGTHHLLDHDQEVAHDLLLAVAEGLVLEEEQADGEAILEVLDLEQLVDGALDQIGEERELGREQLLAGGLLGRGEQGGDPQLGQEGEAVGDDVRLGQPVKLPGGPPGDVEMVVRLPVARHQDAAVQLDEDRGQRGASGRAFDQVAQQHVALEERGELVGQQPGQRAADLLQTRVVRVAVPSVEDLGAPHQKAAEQERELLVGQGPVEQPDHELRDEVEQPAAIVRALEVGPVAQKDRLEPLDEEVRIAVRVEVLAHRVGERGAHAVQAFHRLEERQVAIGDDHLLRGAGDVGAQGV